MDTKITCSVHLTYVDANRIQIGMFFSFQIRSDWNKTGMWGWCRVKILKSSNDKATQE